MRAVLNPGGLFIMDALNARKARWIKLAGGKKRLITFDELYFKKEFIAELDANGFRVVEMVPVVNHFFTQFALSRIFYILGLRSFGFKVVSFLERFGGNNPWEWVVVCQKK